MSVRRKTRYTEEIVITAAEIFEAEAWHLIRAPSHKVLEAAAVLDAMGVKVWAPLQVSWTRVGRSSLRICKRPVNYPAFFNYMFFGVTRGAPDWVALFKTGYIRAVVADVSGGYARPFIIPAKDIARAAIAARQGTFNARRTAENIFDQKPKAGDLHKVRDGQSAIFGRTVRLERVEDGQGFAIEQILGNKVEFEFAC